VQSIPHEKQWDFFLVSCSIPFVPSPLVCLSSVVGVTSLPLLSKMLRRRSRPSPFVTGVEEAARSVAGRDLPAVTVGFGPGWKGCRPRGVSAMTRKWPVNGGPILEGRD